MTRSCRRRKSSVDAWVADRPRTQVLPEQLGRAALGRRPARRTRPGDRRRELRVDPHLQGTRQQRDHLLPQPRAGRLAHPHPQEVLPQGVSEHRQFRERAAHRPQPPGRRDRDIRDRSRCAGCGLHEADDRGVLLLTEVDRERGAAVVHGARGGHALAPVQVAERHVVRLHREDRRGHGVLEDRLRGPLAATHPAVENGEVGQHQVHGVVPEADRQRGQDVAELLVVRPGVLGGRPRDQLGGAHRVARGEERQHRARRPLARRPGGELHDAAALGRAHRPDQRDPGRARERAVGIQRGGVVVVARDRDDRRARAGQRHQGADHQLLGGGGGRRTVVEVAGDEHGVDLVLPRDPDDLAEHLLLLVEPRLPLERLADVPVGRVQEPHEAAIVGAGTSRPVTGGRRPSLTRRSRPRRCARARRTPATPPRSCPRGSVDQSFGTRNGARSALQDRGP